MIEPGSAGNLRQTKAPDLIPNNDLACCRWVAKLFTPEECDLIIQMNGEIREAHVVSKEITNIYDPVVRSCTIKHVGYAPTNHWLFDRLGQVINVLNDMHYRFDIVKLSTMQIIEYRQGGFYDWHTDLGRGGTSTRKLSIIVMLSDPATYQGGQLELMPRYDGIPQGHGDMIVFPPFLTHRVTPVTQGVRYALVAWAHGPCFK